MALNRDQIEHLENWMRDKSKPWKSFSASRKFLKRQMHKFMRIRSKKINIEEENDFVDKEIHVSPSHLKRMTKGWEW